MWSNVLEHVEGIIGSLALIVTTIVGLILTIREAVKGKKKDPAADAIVQGQTVNPEPDASAEWLAELREDADELRDENRILTNRLTKALIRLAANGIAHDDI